MTATRLGMVLLVLASIACFVACGGGGQSISTNNGGSSAPSQAQEVGNAAQARVYAENWVTEYVQENVRHTVSFPMFSQEASYLPPVEGVPLRHAPLWRVKGVFNVTNVFGGEVQHTYDVSMSVEETADKIVYSPVSVKISGETKYISESHVAEVIAKSEELANQQAASQEAQRQADAKADAEQRRAENTRTWKDATGSHSIEATFVKMIAGKVTLKKPDGSQVDISLEKLSDDDRQWVMSKFRN